MAQRVLEPIGSETYVNARLASPASGSTPARLGIRTAVIVEALSPAVCTLAIGGTASSPALAAVGPGVGRRRERAKGTEMNQ